MTDQTTAATAEAQRPGRPASLHADLDRALRQRIRTERRETFGTGRLRTRYRRCYEIAALVYAIDRTLPEGSVLVHGDAYPVERSTGEVLECHRGHAWLILPDRRVWDPVTCETWNADEWQEAAQPVNTVRYETPDQYAKALAANGYLAGPLHQEVTR
ncbi:hypothetical protein [Streptomyces sp. RPT161]|uniref:hypothetical protein n=1 Tax=Streptomyces sp. RPT161 TaxID=3015993 RepID=UPI0022B8D931|nr:hypothetical protein [Streptomyces sp. RPT161]